MIALWFIIFVASLFVLIKASDLFTETSEKIGMAFRFPAFIVGVTLVSIGTSLPELASSLVAVFRDQSEIVVANAFGSNIANILLIVGIAGIFSRVLKVDRSLIDIDLPLLSIVTVLTVFVTRDGVVTLGEGVISILAYAVYVAYTLSTREKENAAGVESEIKEDIKEVTLPEERRRTFLGIPVRREASQDVHWGTIVIFFGSIAGVYLGAEGTVRSIVALANIFAMDVSVIVMSALAVGTSLPELAVSLQVVRKKKYEMALGNIFGSNVFNALIVIGFPALFSSLTVDATTLTVGIPFLIGATALYIVSGISQNIYAWEGGMFLLLYALFLAKLFGAF